MKKICVVTGTRAEYGLLQKLIKMIDEDSTLALQLVATGMHLSPEFGLTYREIEEDGFSITEKVEVLLSSDTEVGICKSIGLGVGAFGEVFARLQPDLLLILGDRFEILSAAIAGMIHRIPIAHIHGGELTQGVIDDPMRHAITKMSFLHFTSTEEYRRRVVQLGENPSRVFYVGALGVEAALCTPLLSQDELEKQMGFHFDQCTAMVTLHPVTLEDHTAQSAVEQMLAAIDDCHDMKFIFTKANADTNGRIINEILEKYAAEHPKKAAIYTSLGRIRYLSALRYCDMVIGNSSSGILEAPSFGIPTINIGERQKGRVTGQSVIQCGTQKEDIYAAIAFAKSAEMQERLKDSNNPYDKPGTSRSVLKEIKKYLMSGESGTQKVFYDIDMGAYLM